MSNNAYDSHGVTLEVSLDGQVSWSEILDVTDVEAPGRTADKHETSDHSSASKTWLGSMIDEGELSIGLNTRPDNTVHQALTDNVGTNIDWRMTFPPEITTRNCCIFVGLLEEFGSIKLPRSGVITNGVKVAVSGAKAWSTV